MTSTREQIESAEEQQLRHSGSSALQDPILLRMSRARAQSRQSKQHRPSHAECEAKAIDANESAERNSSNRSNSASQLSERVTFGSALRIATFDCLIGHCNFDWPSWSHPSTSTRLVRSYFTWAHRIRNAIEPLEASHMCPIRWNQ